MQALRLILESTSSTIARTISNNYVRNNLSCNRNIYLRLYQPSILNIPRRTLQYTIQHDALRETVRKIVVKDINPNVSKWEEEEDFPSHEIFKTFGDAGLLGITRDPEYGGLGLDYSYSMAFFEELAAIDCGGIPTAITVHTDMTLPALASFGSDKLKREFLMPTVKGDYVASVAISEPSGGSDVAAIKTTAKESGDDLIINGSKMWITNGYHCDWLCLLANTSDGPPHRNKSLICVPKNTKGLTVGKKIKKMGMKCSDTALLYFEDVRVPKSHIIGEPNMGFTYQMLQFVDERVCASVVACHQMERLVKETINFCCDRKTFGKPLINNQVIHFRLAELQSEIELLKSLNHRIADMIISGENMDHGSSSSMLAAISKLKAGRLIREVGDTCLQFYGGMGYSSDMLVERFYRDARVLSIAGGADEIMIGIVAKFMGILSK